MEATHQAEGSLTLSERIEELMGKAGGQVPGLDEARHQGPAQRISAVQIITALVVSIMQVQGSIGQVARRLFNMDISDAALSQRRARMGEDIFQLVLRHTLRALADALLHPCCFLGQWRLVGIDGTHWSLINTLANNQAVGKVKSRRGQAAFGKVMLCALVELGTHAPLAAALGFEDKNEQGVSLTLLAQLPPRSLLILDRLYGSAPVLHALQEHCPASSSHYLVRVRGKLAVEVLKPHRDGSAQVQVSLRDKERPRQVNAVMETREVRGQVWSRSQKQWVEVRLWTSLSPQHASARELLAAYAKRWEQELCYRELKMDLRGSELLRSQTPVSAAQELLCMLIGCSILAGHRLAAAGQSGDPAVQQAGAVRISFGVCRQHMLGLWLTLEAGATILSEEQKRALTIAVHQQIAAQALRERRPRTCQRKVRQPITKWPRMLEPTSWSSPLKSKILRIT